MSPPASPETGTAKVALVKAPSLDEARRDAAAQLGVPGPELTLTVVERHRVGFLGLGGEQLTVEARWSPSAVASAAPAGAQSTGAPSVPVQSSPPQPLNARLSCARGRISLVVTRPGPGQRAASKRDIEALLAGLPISARDDDAIEGALRASDGVAKPVAAVPAKPVDPAADPVAIHVTSDGLRAWLVPWMGGEIRGDWLEAALAGAGVNSGIDREVAAAVVASYPLMPIAVATGVHASDGADATVTYVIAQDDGTGRPGAGDDDPVNLREVKTFGVPARVDGVVATKTPLVPSADGVTVLGVVVPGIVGKDLDLQKVAGKGVRLSDDGLALLATVAGSASWVAGKLCVAPLTAVSGDVDYASGNVRVEGDLTIGGSIVNGFIVEASGNIAVMGAIEGAKVRAGGSLVVIGGIIGQDIGTVDAGGAVTARFIDGATIRAGGNVTVAAEVRHSTVLSDGSVVVGGGRGAGRITGGLTRGRLRVEANEIGAESGTPTKVQCGWGRELDAPDLEPVEAPRIVARAGARPGVSLTVGGATAAITAPTPGGYWREVDGKLSFVTVGR